MKVIVSSENPDVVYLDFTDVRIIFREGQYAGWYIPGEVEREGE